MIEGTRTVDPAGIEADCPPWCVTGERHAAEQYAADRAHLGPIEAVPMSLADALRYDEGLRLDALEVYARQQQHGAPTVVVTHEDGCSWLPPLTVGEARALAAALLEVADQTEAPEPIDVEARLAGWTMGGQR